MNHDKPDRVPVWPMGGAIGFCGVNAGCTIADMYTRPQVALDAERRIHEQYGWVFVPYHNYGAYGAWEFGGEIKWPSSEYTQAPSIARYPVQTEEDAWILRLPDVRHAGIIPIETEYLKLALQQPLGNNQPFKVFIAVHAPFTTAANLCGPDKLCKWLIKRPEVAKRLLRLATDHLLELVRYWRDTLGVDEVVAFQGDPTSSNQLISPRHFQEFALPYLIELNRHILSLGFKHIYFHVCGDQNGNLPYLSQVPLGDPGIVSIGPELDLAEASKVFAGHVMLGNIDSSAVQTGTPASVYALCVQAIEKGKACPDGFVLSPGCALPPRASPANVRMLAKAADDCGWYE